MLGAEAFAAWFLALYMTVVTRDIAAAIFESAFFLGTVALLTTGPDGEIFTYAFRRPAFALYGGVAGYALAAALRSRTLVPTHSFSNTATHLAGPIVLVGVAYATTTLISATDLSKVDAADDTLPPLLTLAISITVFVLLALGIIIVLCTSCLDVNSALTFRYSDERSRVELKPALPTSRLAAEMVLLSALLLAPLAVWVTLPTEPTNWPQWGAGVLSMSLTLVGFVLMFLAVRTRHAMDRVHFSTARVPWAWFVGVVGGVYAAAAITWVIVAEFATTQFQAEATLLGLTAAVIALSVGIVAVPRGRWRQYVELPYGGAPEHVADVRSAWTPKDDVSPDVLNAQLDNILSS